MTAPGPILKQPKDVVDAISKVAATVRDMQKTKPTTPNQYGDLLSTIPRMLATDGLTLPATAPVISALFAANACTPTKIRLGVNKVPASANILLSWYLGSDLTQLAQVGTLTYTSASAVSINNSVIEMSLPTPLVTAGSQYTAVEISFSAVAGYGIIGRNVTASGLQLPLNAGQTWMSYSAGSGAQITPAATLDMSATTTVGPPIQMWIAFA